MAKENQNTPPADDNQKMDPLLQAAVDEKDYLREGVTEPGATITPAPDFTFQSASNAPSDNSVFFSPESTGNSNKAKTAESNTQQSSSGGSAQNSGYKQSSRIPSEPFNPGTSDMKPSEKTMSAKQMAKMAVATYEWLHQFPNKWVKVNMDKMRKLERKGKVDMLIGVKYDGDYVTVKQLIEEYNKSVDGIFKVSQEFKDEIIPPLTRELEKGGFGMSDRDIILYALAKDLAPKILLGVQCWQGQNSIVNAIMQATEEKRRQTGFGAEPNGVPLRDPVVSSTPPPPPPPPPPPAQRETPPPPPPPPPASQVSSKTVIQKGSIMTAEEHIGLDDDDFDENYHEFEEILQEPLTGEKDNSSGTQRSSQVVIIGEGVTGDDLKKKGNNKTRPSAKKKDPPTGK